MYVSQPINAMRLNRNNIYTIKYERILALTWWEIQTTMHKYKVRFIGPTTIVHSPQRPTTKPRHAKIFNYHNKYLRFIEFVIRRSSTRLSPEVANENTMPVAWKHSVSRVNLLSAGRWWMLVLLLDRTLLLAFMLYWAVCKTSAAVCRKTITSANIGRWRAWTNFK